KKNTSTDGYIYGVTIKNMRLEGNFNNIGIYLKKSSHVLIENVYIYFIDIGIKADSAWLAHYNRVTVRNYSELKRGSIGFQILGGTSNTFTNTWVQNFVLGYDTASHYTLFNNTAFDDFTEGAYHARQTTTFNSAGAEKGRLTNGGWVYRVDARGAVFNAPETLNIKYVGESDGSASFFRFN